MVKCISILGSTGSIGRQTLDIIDNLGLPVAALTAGSNAERMAQQCRKYRPKLAVMSTQAAAEELKTKIADLPTEIMWGEEGLIAAATIPEADCIITAVVGMVGLKPTLAAIRARKRIGLANKETLVCAGQLVMAEAKKYNAEIIPVDSEHSAIFQCLMGCNNKREVKHILLTCSGGPFYGKSKEELGIVTKADALKHPNWKMGAKITIDCATLMNKGFEVIEAVRLFGVSVEQVEVLVHRQSIIHSMVEYIDNTVIAQLGAPDMRSCIRYAASYPTRAWVGGKGLDFAALHSLTFDAPDTNTFPLLDAARDAIRRGGVAPTALVAADEEAVASFLRSEISLNTMAESVMEAMAMTADSTPSCVEDIYEAEQTSRKTTRLILQKYTR